MVKKKKVHETVIREVIEKPVKKQKRKKPVRKRAASSSKKISSSKIENALIENFISLQKVMVNLSVKFDNLTTQISKLLELFEISAKALAEKEFVTDKEKKDNKEVLDKMDKVIDQNKILARGLTLMHDRITEESEIPLSPPTRPMMPRQNPAMRLPVKQKIPEMKSNSPVKQMDNSLDDTYQRSISSHNDSVKKSF